VLGRGGAAAEQLAQLLDRRRVLGHPVLADPDGDRGQGGDAVGVQRPFRAISAQASAYRRSASSRRPATCASIAWAQRPTLRGSGIW
jgi:hypothetical protein